MQVHPVLISLFFNTLENVLRPLNLGSKEGCILTIFFSNLLIILLEIIFIYPAKHIKEILNLFKFNKISFS